jgi:hypothetical protein
MTEPINTLTASTLPLDTRIYRVTQDHEVDYLGKLKSVEGDGLRIQSKGRQVEGRWFHSFRDFAMFTEADAYDFAEAQLLAKIEALRAKAPKRKVSK